MGEDECKTARLLFLCAKNTNFEIILKLNRNNGESFQRYSKKEGICRYRMLVKVSEIFQRKEFEKTDYISEIVQLLTFGKINKNNMLKMLKMWKKNNFKDAY